MSNLTKKEPIELKPEIESAIAGAIAAYLNHDKFEIVRVSEYRKENGSKDKKSFWTQNMNFIMSFFGSRNDID